MSYPRELAVQDAVRSLIKSRIVPSVAATNASAVLMLLDLRDLPARRHGTVGGADLSVSPRFS